MQPVYFPTWQGGYYQWMSCSLFTFWLDGVVITSVWHAARYFLFYIRQFWCWKMPTEKINCTPGTSYLKRFFNLSDTWSQKSLFYWINKVGHTIQQSISRVGNELTINNIAVGLKYSLSYMYIFKDTMSHTVSCVALRSTVKSGYEDATWPWWESKLSGHKHLQKGTSLFMHSEWALRAQLVPRILTSAFNQRHHHRPVRAEQCDSRNTGRLKGLSGACAHEDRAMC